MRILTGAIVAVALAGSSAAQAQIYVADPPLPPPVVYAPPPPVYVAPPAVYAAPGYVAPMYGAPAYVPPTTVNPYTGRICTIEPSGYRWCWTP